MNITLNWRTVSPFSQWDCSTVHPTDLQLWMTSYCVKSWPCILFQKKIHHFSERCTPNAVLVWLFHRASKLLSPIPLLPTPTPPSSEYHIKTHGTHSVRSQGTLVGMMCSSCRAWEWDRRSCLNIKKRGGGGVTIHGYIWTSVGLLLAQ